MKASRQRGKGFLEEMPARLCSKQAITCLVKHEFPVEWQINAMSLGAPEAPKLLESGKQSTQALE